MSEPDRALLLVSVFEDNKRQARNPIGDAGAGLIGPVERSTAERKRGRLAPVLLVLLLAGSVHAAPIGDRAPLPRRPPSPAPSGESEWCATGPELERRLERLHQFVEEREQGRFRMAATGIRIDKGVYVMETDSGTVPFDHPFDLQNSTLNLTRTSATAFSVQKTALDYDLDVGTLRQAMSGYVTEAYHIGLFAFPFYGSSVSDIVITSNKGIFLTTPPASQFYQFSGLEALMQRVPLIAPLLNTSDKPNGYYNLYVKETASAVTITWRSRSTFETNEDIQVTLFSSGNIRLSYRTVTNVAHGAVIVTSGAESWYDSATSIGSFPDSGTDVNAALPAAVRDMLEIESVQARRVSNSDLIEFVITTKAAIDRSVLAAGQYLLFQVYPGNTSAERSANRLYARLEVSQTFYEAGAWYYVKNSPALTISGRTLTLRVLDEQMSFASLPVTVNVYADYYSPTSTAGDIASGTAAMTAGLQFSQTDLSSLTAATALANKPVVEAFTLPSLDVRRAWDRLKAAYGLTDTDIDQVAIYQTFYTDLIFYAGAYSTNSNPQVDNIIAPGWRSQYGSTFAKRASLLHMDKTGHGWNASANGILSVLTHEFGHRWLYSFSIREGSTDTFSLNPDVAHPKRGVHLPAAFNVITATDTSAMGGGHFTQTGPTTYLTAPQPGYYGFSWHELYLMGLADSAEVTAPWFYLSAPSLEGAYFPSSNTTYTVTSRTDVVQSQITTAMGMRSPGYATSQKSFKLVYVLLERPGSPVSSADATSFSALYAKPLKSHFAATTGSRGALKIAPDSMPPEADFEFSPSPPSAGAAVSFTDLSYGEPTSWSWDFDDLGTSTAQNPTHTFASAGTYNVQLTATKAAGSHSIIRSVIVSGTPTNVVATAVTTSSVLVTWTSSPGITYEVQRTAAGGVTSTLGTSTSGSFTDNLAGANVAYLYKVRTIAPGTSPYSAPDVATTVFFTDPVLTANSTIVKVAHFTELRAAINLVRALAGMGAASVTRETLTPQSTVIMSVDLTELRTALGAARTTLVLPALTYANSAAAGTAIRAADIDELRNGLK